jgi:predicted phosphoribosyltransferase
VEVFEDRTDAGKRLAEYLGEYAGRAGLLVLGLPRGGVVVAAEVAKALDAELDAVVVRKLGVPGREELAMGAVASGGIRVLNNTVIDTLGLVEDDIERVAAEEEARLAEQEELFRAGENPASVGGRPVIVVDDGLATGASMRVALQAVRAADPQLLVAAVPTGSAEALELVSQEADRVVSVMSPEDFGGVSLWYREFGQVSNEEVRAILSGR